MRDFAVSSVINEKKNYSPLFFLPIFQFADNRYRPFDNRHRPIIGGLFALVIKTTKNALTAVHIDDNEVTNDSIISHVSSCKNYKLVKLRQECYQSTIVPL